VRFTQAHIDEVLDAYPRLHRRPSRDAQVALLQGKLRFVMSAPGWPELNEAFEVRIEVPLRPHAGLPRCFETGGRIPRDPDHHVNPSGDLCLGSPLRLAANLGPTPTVLTFVDRCVVPFLYAAALNEQGAASYAFGELEHGNPGLITDYGCLLGLPSVAQIVQAMNLLGARRRHSNRRPCPCKCGRRLGRCTLRLLLNRLRYSQPRSAFREMARSLAPPPVPSNRQGTSRVPDTKSLPQWAFSPRQHGGNAHAPATVSRLGRFVMPPMVARTGGQLSPHPRTRPE